MSMEKKEFHNALRILRSLDVTEIDHRIGPEGMEYDQWEEFRDDPYEFFIKCDDRTCDAIWAAMQKRMK